MDNSISLSGLASIVAPAPGACNGGFHFDFHPTEPEGVAVVNPCKCNGCAQLMRDGTVSFTAAKKRTRNDKMLLAKAAHGRLSLTLDKARKLTLRIPLDEEVCWQRVFVEESLGLIKPHWDSKSLRSLLVEMLNQIKE